MYLLQFSAVFLESSAMEYVYEVLKFVYFLLYKLNWIELNYIFSNQEHTSFPTFSETIKSFEIFFQIHFQSNLNKSFIMSIQTSNMERIYAGGECSTDEIQGSRGPRSTQICIHFDVCQSLWLLITRFHFNKKRLYIFFALCREKQKFMETKTI